MHAGRHDEVDSRFSLLIRTPLKIFNNLLFQFDMASHSTVKHPSTRCSSVLSTMLMLSCATLPRSCFHAFTCVKRHSERQAAQAAWRHDGRFLVPAFTHVRVGNDTQARAARRRTVPTVVVAAISAPVRHARTRFTRSLSLVNMAVLVFLYFQQICEYYMLDPASLPMHYTHMQTVPCSAQEVATLFGKSFLPETQILRKIP